MEADSTRERHGIRPNQRPKHRFLPRYARFYKPQTDTTAQIPSKTHGNGLNFNDSPENDNLYHPTR